MFYKLSDLGFIKIQGSDAKKFLQGQLTCDVESVTSSHSQMGAHCNPQGRVISLFYLFLYENAYYMLMQHSMVNIALTALKKYAVFFKVELTDASEMMVAVGCNESKLLDQNNLITIPVSPNNTRCIYAGSKDDFENHMKKNPEESSMKSYDKWQCLNINEHIPSIYPETSGKFLPHEIGLTVLEAVSFNKGCYTGQEIIARMHYRGKLKNHMYKVATETDITPMPGAEVYALSDNAVKPCGMVVDVCRPEYNNYIALIVMDESKVMNNTLCLDVDKKTVISLS